MKLKEKLIHWLGGYTFQERKQVNIIQTTKPIITLRSVSKIDPFLIIDKEAQEEYVKQELAIQLAEDMANKGFIEFSTDEKDYITATVRVVDMQ